MRTALLAFATVIASQAAHAATAYEALRVLGEKKGEAFLDNTTEVRGEKGAPEPKSWKITVKSSAGSTSGKTFTVQGKQIAGDRAGRAEGSALNMSQLSLDSDGAHTVAEREAKKTAFAYDHASYWLHSGSKSGAPVWEVRLIDEQSGSTGTVNISATTGKVLSTDGLSARRKPIAAAPVEDPAPTPAPAPAPAPEPRYQPVPDERPTKGRGATEGIRRASDDTNEFLDRAGQRVGNHLERRGKQIGDFFHNLFTGDHRDTAGPHHGSRPAPARGAADEDYVKPSRVRD
jgi:hypothetical protein